MKCILCLDNAELRHIEIYSAEGEHLDIQRIVEKHFWFHLDRTEESFYKSTICETCWQSVLSFHEFYLRVEKIHKQQAIQTEFDGSINPLETFKPQEAETIYIKEELPVEVDKSANPKRSRGRPRKTPIDKSDIEISLPDIEKVIAEDFLVIDIKEEHASGRDALNVEQCLEIGQDEHNKTEVRQISTRSKQHHGSLRQVRTSPRLHKVPDAITDDESVELDVRSKSSCDSGDKKVPKLKKQRTECTKMIVSKQHDEFIATNFKLNCCLCQEPLNNFTALKAHFRTEHSTRGYVMCCNKKLLKRGVLVDHIHTHLDPQYFKCPQCDRISADRNCLDIHMKTHDNKRERVHRCDVCSKSFVHQSSYNRHILTHLPEEYRTIACPQCEKTFANNYTMRQHLRLVHLNMYAKICDICGKSYRGREEFRRHQDEHAGVQHARIQCECGSSFTNKYRLRRHMREVHNEKEKGPHICSICSKESHNLSAHNSHMKYVHTMERKHACPMCDKAFKRPRDLKEHMTTHTGEVLYTCPHCPKTFNSKANMHSHRKKMHRQEWEERRMQIHQQSHSIHQTVAQL